MNRVKGVSRDSRGDRWQARARINGTTKHLGYYRDWFDAVCARKSFENGHFKKTNLRKQPNIKSPKKYQRKTKTNFVSPCIVEQFYLRGPV